MQADALAGCCEHLDMAPAVIAGGSGGARVSLLAAARHPDVAAGAGDVVDHRPPARAPVAGHALLLRVAEGGVGRRHGGGGRPARSGPRCSSGTRPTATASSPRTATRSSPRWSGGWWCTARAGDDLVPGLRRRRGPRLRRADARVPQRRRRLPPPPIDVGAHRRGAAERPPRRAAVGRPRVARAPGRADAGSPAGCSCGGPCSSRSSRRGPTSCPGERTLASLTACRPSRRATSTTTRTTSRSTATRTRRSAASARRRRSTTTSRHDFYAVSRYDDVERGLGRPRRRSSPGAAACSRSSRPASRCRRAS